MEGMLVPIQEDLYQDFRRVAEKKFALSLRELAELTTARARQQQREISSEVQTGCQVLLRDTFDAAKDMKGTGSHQRRKTMVELGAREANYEDATVGMVQGISALQEQVREAWVLLFGSLLGAGRTKKVADAGPRYLLLFGSPVPLPGSFWVHFAPGFSFLAPF